MPAVGGSSGLPGFSGPVGRTNGRLGFDVDPDANAAPRTVSSPEGVSINRMPVLAHPAINIPEHDQTHVHALAKQAAGLFNKEVSFCRQTKEALNGAITYLELWEPRLTVCIRSWGACSLLSSVANDAAEYRARARKRAAAGTNTMPATMPPPLPAPPVAAPRLHEAAASGSAAAPAGAAASDFETADDFFAAT